MFVTSPSVGDRVRRRWHSSQQTAETLYPVRRLFPTNRIRDAVYSRRGLKWGVPAMLPAAPYFGAIKFLTEYIEQAGPAWGWLHLVVLLCAWNALKMLWLGPMSLIYLAPSVSASSLSAAGLGAKPKRTAHRMTLWSRREVRHEGCALPSQRHGELDLAR